MSHLQDEIWLEHWCEEFFEKNGREPTDEEIRMARINAEADAYDLRESEATGN